MALFQQPYICGDVVVEEGVAIAAGVMLIADPGSRLVVESGVCLGANTLLHARQGDLHVEANGVVGQDSLIIGHGRIGACSCVGSASTLLNPSLGPNQVVAANTYPGQPRPEVSLQGESSGSPPHHQLNGQGAVPQPRPGESGGHREATMAVPAEANGSSPIPEADLPTQPPPTEAKLNGHAQISGRRQVEQLLKTLFPHRRSFGSSNGEDPP